jgi:hypothetical protein
VWLHGQLEDRALRDELRRARRRVLSESNAIRIVRVSPAGAHALLVRWMNGKTLSVDLHEPVFRLKGLRPMRDTAVFACAAVGEGGHSVVWPGDRDMGADRLWEMTLEQNGRGRERH